MKSIKNAIEIMAKPADVWELLVDPTQTQKYMYGCRAVSNWNVGSKLEWEMMHEGQPLVVVKGVVKHVEPNNKLVYTVIDPFADYADLPENHLQVTYILEETSKGTSLTVLQEGFETVAQGEKRYQEAFNKGEGWQPLLKHIKAIAENEEV